MTLTSLNMYLYSFGRQIFTVCFRLNLHKKPIMPTSGVPKKLDWSIFCRSISIRAEDKCINCTNSMVESDNTIFKLQPNHIWKLSAKSCFIRQLQKAKTSEKLKTSNLWLESDLTNCKDHYSKPTTYLNKQFWFKLTVVFIYLIRILLIQGWIGIISTN